LCVSLCECIRQECKNQQDEAKYPRKEQEDQKPRRQEQPDAEGARQYDTECDKGLRPLTRGSIVNADNSRERRGKHAWRAGVTGGDAKTIISPVDAETALTWSIAAVFAADGVAGSESRNGVENDQDDEKHEGAIDPGTETEPTDVGRPLDRKIGYLQAWSNPHRASFRVTS
jgi:hypothetical protein